MTGRARLPLAALCAGLFAGLQLAAGPAAACAYHGGADFGRLSARPEAVAVAIALGHARSTGLISPRRHDPGARLFGYQRLARRLAGLSRCMAGHAAAGDAAADSFSLLVAEPGLWARYRPGSPPALDTGGPAPGDRVVTVAEAVLPPLADGRLSVDAAVEAGLIAASGDGALPPRLAPCLAAPDPRQGVPHVPADPASPAGHAGG